VLYRALLAAGYNALFEATRWPCGARPSARRALWVSALKDPPCKRAWPSLLGRERQVEVVLWRETSFASVHSRRPDLGRPLWEALNVRCCNALRTQGRDQCKRQQQSALALSTSALQWRTRNSMAAITHAVGAFKELLRADQGPDTALLRLPPDSERPRLDRPSCCGPW